MDELQLLGTILTKPDPSPEAFDRVHHRLQNTMRGNGPARRSRSGRLAGGLALTAAATTGLIVVATGSRPHTATPHSPPAAAAKMSPQQILLAAASTVEKTPEGSGTYWYVKTVSDDGIGTKPIVTENWTTRNGQMWVRSAKGGNKVYPELGPVTAFSVGGVDMTFAQIQKLPTDPAALRARIADAIAHSDIRTSAGRPDAAAQAVFVFDGLAGLVTALPAPPKVRAAAFRAIAKLPGVTSLGPVKGGQGLLIPVHGETARLVVDPATGRVHDTNFLALQGGGEEWLPSNGGATIYAQWTDTLPS